MKHLPDNEINCIFPDSKAQKGEKALKRGLSSDEIEKLARTGQHKRDERFRAALNLVLCAVPWLAFTVITIMVIVWLCNICFPITWCWLKGDRLSYLQTLIMGIGTGILSNTFLPYALRKMK